MRPTTISRLSRLPVNGSRTAAALFHAALLLIAPGAFAAGGNGYEIRAGIFDFPPLCRTSIAAATRDIRHPDSLGLFIAILEHVAQQEAWTIAYVPGSVGSCMQWLDSGAVDVVTAMPFSQENEQRFNFGNQTIISTWAQVYTTGQATVHSPIDLTNRRVGVMRDDPYNTEIRDIVEKFNITCDFIEFTAYEEIFHALEKKWIDVGVIDRLYAAIHEKNHSVTRSTFLFSPIELRFAAPKSSSSDILRHIDYYVERMKNEPYSTYHRQISLILGDNRRTVIPKAVFWILGLIGLSLLMATAAALIFRRQVKKKTAELTAQNNRLIEEIRMRAEAELALKESNELLKQTFAGMQDGLLVIDLPTRTVVASNAAVSRILGCRPEELPQNVSGMLCLYQNGAAGPEPDVIDSLIAPAIANKGQYQGEQKIRRRNMSAVPVEILAAPIKKTGEKDLIVIILRDVSEREALRESEIRLRQAQKMESIGTLAGGIAHDFNNILMPILGYAELMQRQAKKQGDANDYVRFLDQIIRAADRAKALTSQILAFSRSREQEPIMLSVGLIIKETFQLIRPTIPSTIAVRYFIETECDTVLADPTQIHQIIMNLCSNAAFAMRDKGGELDIILREHSGPILGWCEDSALRHDRHYLRLSVRDTGCGIDPAIFHRIFDPFFTTKPAGQGTGMGLSVVHGIVKSYDGFVSVESKLGAGTTFHVYLPRAEMEIKDKDTGADETPVHGNETILFVDDEAMILDMATSVFEDFGYRVVPARNGTDALELFQTDPQRFDIVITDQTMPGMTGFELARTIIRMNPSVPVVLCTGFSESITADKAKSIGIAEFVSKPFVPRQIARTIRRVLDAKKGVFATADMPGAS